MEILPLYEYVYTVIGIDCLGCSELISIFKTYEDAKACCVDCMQQEKLNDLWIEKHPLI